MGLRKQPSPPFPLDFEVHQFAFALRPQGDVIPTDTQQFDVIDSPTRVPVSGDKGHPDGQRLGNQGVAESQVKVAALGLRAGWRDRVWVDG